MTSRIRYMGYLDSTISTSDEKDDKEQSKSLNCDLRSKMSTRTLSSPTYINFADPVRLLCVTGGSMFYLNKDSRLVEHRLLSSHGVLQQVVDLKLDTSAYDQLYVDVVHGNIYLLARTPLLNDVIRWRNEEQWTPTEEDIFHTVFNAEEERVEQFCGTDVAGFLLTSLKRVWIVHGWNSSKPRGYSMELVPCDSPIRQISCGKEHLAALTEDGRVLTMGKSSRGQLGFGSTASSETALRCLEILEPLRFVKIACGGWHTLVLSESGDIYGWGWNESGQVGTRCGESEAGELLEEVDSSDDGVGRPTTTKDDVPNLVFTPSLVETPLEKTFVSIAAGSRHSVALTDDGAVYGWGWNGYGQLNDTSPRETATKGVNIQFLIPTLLRVNDEGQSSSGIAAVKEIKCFNWCTVLSY